MIDYERLYLEEQIKHCETTIEASCYLKRVADLQVKLASIIIEKHKDALDEQATHKDIKEKDDGTG